VGLFRSADRLDDWALPKLQEFFEGWPGVTLVIGNAIFAIGLFVYAQLWDFSGTAAWGLVIAWVGIGIGIVVYAWARKRRTVTRPRPDP